MAVGLHPFHDLEHEQIEEHGADQRGGGAGHQTATGVHDRVAGDAEVVEDVIGNLVKFFAAGMHGGCGGGHGGGAEADHVEALGLGVERHLDGRGVFAGVGNDDDGFARQ